VADVDIEEMRRQLEVDPGAGGVWVVSWASWPSLEHIQELPRGIVSG
jgi:hypothetical protein